MNKSSQIIMSVLAIVLGFLKQYFPQIPQEAVYATMTYVVGTMFGQIFGSGEGNKPAWKTSEFWATFVVGGIKGLWPEFPDQALWTALAFIGIRPVVKSSVGFSLPALVDNFKTKEKPCDN